MLNIVIPMSGKGSRLQEAGFQLPKPLIDVNGQPMIKRVIENLGLTANYIFIVLKEHYHLYSLDELLPQFCQNNSCHIITVDEITQGAACTCLLAEQLINNNNSLIIANSDQLMEWNPLDFIESIKDLDGGIVSFIGTEDKWSFAKLDYNTNLVSEVAEKKVISNNATAGVYWFKHGIDFVNAAHHMISKNIRTNNEYYVCPVFNELIADGKKIGIYSIDKFWGIGTPADLANYLNDKKIN